MSKSTEIKKKVRKRRKNNPEIQNLNYDAEIVDLGDGKGENIEVETFSNGSRYEKPAEFSTAPQKKKRSISETARDLIGHSRAILKQLKKQSEKILALEEEYSKLTDEQLAAKTEEFKKELENGKSTDDILIPAFAAVREAAYRTIGLKAFPVQLMGGIVLHNGDIAEMKTGEGKTLVGVFPVYLNALEGKGVHVVTTNEYLARRDSELNGRVFKFLGLTVGLNLTSLSAKEKREAFNCDITYTTHAELGFDYLRDNMVTDISDKVMRGMHYALVDEADSVLIDEARTPLIISGGKKHMASMYMSADRFVKSLKEGTDYTTDLKTKSSALTPEGSRKAEKAFKIDNLYSSENMSVYHFISQALKANCNMEKDVDYIVATENGSHDIRDAEIMLIDQFTGRVMPGRSYSDGLHQALEAKEGVPIHEETMTMATITYQNFFRLYDKLAGMTGTAKTEEEELRQVYNMRVICIPTNRPIIREDKPDMIFATKQQKYAGIIKEVKRRHAYGQPILLGTASVETSEILSSMLKKEGIPHNVLNAKNHAKEAEMVSLAGQKGAVTIATNMAGRGTDIKLGEGVKELGGLMVLGSEKHESRRIDNQLRGRSGRQGDPGCSQFYVSFEDDITKRFGGEKSRAITRGAIGDYAYESKSISKTIENIQERIEHQNYSSRKDLLQYDDVMRGQREVMYRERDGIMASDDLSDIIRAEFRTAILNDIPDCYVPRKTKITKKGKKKESSKKSLDLNMLAETVADKYMLNSKIVIKNVDKAPKNNERIAEIISDAVYRCYRDRFRKDLSDADINYYERSVMLYSMDRLWTEHIDEMEKLKNSIYLRSYAQRDPFQEYTKEGFALYRKMIRNISQEIASSLSRMGISMDAKADIQTVTAVIDFAK